MTKGLFERLQDNIEGREKQKAIGPLDLLELPEALRMFMQRIIRHGQTSARELAQEMEDSEETLESMLQSLAGKGYLAVIPATIPPRYKAVLGERRARELPSGIWDMLSKKIENEP
ncbi:FeoC-like transcriptional regulator [Candidatus Bipolaricaulota bacterium]